MALDPQTIKEQREQTPQFQVDGDITSTSLFKRDNECLNTYQSKVDTGTEEISFNYVVLVNDCTTDSIYDIKSKPFIKGSNVTLTLTESEPHYMITSKTNYVPEIQNTPVPFIIISVILLAVVILAIVFRRGKRER